MGSVFKVGSRWYIRFKDRDGKWKSRSAADTKKEAEWIVREVERELAKPEEAPAAAPQAPQTLRDVAPAWLDGRDERGIRNIENDRAHVHRHILPELGDVPLAELRIRHIKAFMLALQKKGLAPRTVRHIYGTLHKLFADLVVDEIIPGNPCQLTKDQIPKLRDKNPEWRGGAVFSREEVEGLIGSERLPLDRRVLYAILFLTGARFGEASGLRWRDLDTRAAPLQRLTIARSYDQPTKTDVPRQVPVHPVLATLLSTWRKGGWVELIGRQPKADDLMIPSRLGQFRSRHQARNKFLEDLERLGFRARRVHDARRTFITLARVDGARADVLEWITHTPPASMMNLYSTLPWPTLCEAVACLKIEGAGEARRKA